MKTETEQVRFAALCDINCDPDLKLPNVLVLKIFASISNLNVKKAK